MPLYEINGTRVFADVRGPKDAPPLLYVHGGPGATAFDFMNVQGDRLAESVRVIGVDQRGLLRSDPLTPGTELTADLVIADFEALREALGYRSWAILGHSFGGWMATEYAHRHPESVSAVIFDCPGWDADVANKHRLALVADMLDEDGDTEGAERARELMTLARRMTLADDAWSVIARLGDRTAELNFHDPADARRFTAARAASGFSDEDFARGTAEHVAALRGCMFDSAYPRLAELKQPSILIYGRRDPVVPPVPVMVYRESMPDPKVVVLENSSHHAHLEEPDAYAAAVRGFIADVAAS
ncbi:alpha/beta fold hydrolase [Phytomonospora endophytica]|uniref:Proline iminopeptidase n=1 Tax=Phytomonospora endophytica TaxID=714109 RepID=A0A841FSR7_9ACTN|nr:alpha/beta hydrolase [Phytomonospora endophytica]MBB6035569.1 proline iminopeptidase [Phytomonospora endophytica]GIG70068.1 proline iminopeptidase [Phytomonospora endophytica]